jgi:hypothetical protein
VVNASLIIKKFPWLYLRSTPCRYHSHASNSTCAEACLELKHPPGPIILKSNFVRRMRPKWFVRSNTMSIRTALESWKSHRSNVGSKLCPAKENSDKALLVACYPPSVMRIGRNWDLLNPILQDHQESYRPILDEVNLSMDNIHTIW